MDSTHFTKPVTVLVGLGFPRKIRSAYEAYQLLCDMRLATSRGAHRIAMQACKAAIEGKIDAEIARSAFVAFARRTAMLLTNDPNSEFMTEGARRAPLAMAWGQMARSSEEAPIIGRPEVLCWFVTFDDIMDALKELDGQARQEWSGTIYRRHGDVL